MTLRPQSGEVRKARARIESLDIFRALAILAVVGIHVLGHFLPHLERGGPFWIAAAVGNRALQFAVPAFLTLSAFLNIRPLMRGEAMAEYARRRLLRALWPYVLWTILYALFRSREDIGGLTLKQTWAWLLTGNAYYHLYFLLLVLQLYILLPLLVPLFRRRPTFGEAAIVTFALQAALYSLNKHFLWFPAPGSVILWYLPSVALGCWLATRSDRLRAVVRRGATVALFVTLGGLVVYLPQGIALLRDQPINTGSFQFSLWLYTPAAAFLLLAFSEWLVGSSLQRALEPIGARSLEIYLIHPLAIWALDETLVAFLHPKAAIPVYFILCVAAPMALAWLLARLGVSRWLFGVEPAILRR